MAATYLYEVPVVELLSLEPSVGVPAGGTAIAILGRGFQAGAAVTFDGVAATSIVVVSSERLTAVTPAHALGAVDVVVTNTDTSTDTLADGFTYQTTAPSSAVSYRTLAGAGATKMRLTPGATITQHLGQAATFSFSAGFEPAGEQVVEYWTFGTRLFLGTVTHTTERVEGAGRLQVWDTIGTDLSHRLARIYPVGEWIATDGTTIVNALMGSAPGFTAVVEGGLNPLTLKADGRRDLWTLLVEVCGRCGAKPVLLGTTVHVFTVDLGIDPPDVVTEANPDLIWPEGGQDVVAIAWDYSQLRNRVTVYGAEGIVATLDDAASIALYDVIPFPIDDNTLTTSAELHARAQAELDAYALPIPVAHYASRDLRSTVGKSVAISLTRPAISDTFVITTVTIDQLELAAAFPPTKPRFTVTARPASASVRSGGDQGTRLATTVVDLAAAADRSPRLAGDIVSEPGGRTTIPAGSVPATALAGCIDSGLLTPTGVTPGVQGDDAHLTVFTVDAAGRITDAVTDPVPVAKTDGSQPYTAPQSMGGFAITDVLDPVDPQDVATKNYVDTEIAAIVPPTGVKGEVPTGAVNGSNTVYTTAGPFGTTLAVYLNGVRQLLTTDYTETDVDEFTMVTAPLTGDLLQVDYSDTVGGGSAVAGALVLLASQTAAASATLDFVTRTASGQSGALFQSDFDEYVISLIGVLPATDNVDLYLRVSTDGGSTFDAGASAYHWSAWLNSPSFSVGLGSTGAAFINLADNVDNGAVGGVSGSLRAFQPLSTTAYKPISGQLGYLNNDGGRYNLAIAAWYLATTAVNAIRFLFASGNLASGTIRIYGVAT